MTNKKEITLFSDCMNRVTNLADTIDLFEEVDIEKMTFNDLYKMLQARRDFDQYNLTDHRSITQNFQTC